VGCISSHFLGDSVAKNLSKKAYQETLADFRRRNFKEMERNLEVAISIRDGEFEGAKKIKCPHCKKSFEKKLTLAKDVNESIKIISRMLGSLVPEKIEAKDGIPPTQKEKQLSPSELADANELLNEN